MKMKKLLSLALVCALSLALAVPAFADDPANTKTTLSGGYEEPNIDVVVPTTGNLVINPYGLGTTATKSDSTKVPLAGQIMTAPLSIRNKTSMKLSIGADVVATITAVDGKTPMKLTSTTTKGQGTNPEAEGYVAPASGKAAFIQVEVVQAPATVVGQDDTDANKKTLEDLIIDACADEDSWTGSGKVTVASGKTVSGENLAVVKPATFNAGAFDSYGAGSIALFRLSGDCTSGNKAGWETTDTLSVAVAFTFTPVPAEYYTLKLAANQNADHFDSVTVNGKEYTIDAMKAGIKVSVDADVEITTAKSDAGLMSTEGTITNATLSGGSATGAFVAASGGMMDYVPAHYTINANTATKDTVVTITITVDDGT